jgi:hypothetical protein
MTDRDHFAAAALSGLMANPKNDDTTADTIRFWAWNWAEAMLRERERVTEPLLKEKQAEVSAAPVSRPPETRASFSATNHDAAPAARAQLPEADHAACRSRESDAGTGDTEEPVAFAVMSGGRSYDIYDTRGEAEAICRWLCDEESGDIWRVVPLVPLVPCDATPESHATHGECSVPPECTQPVAWWVKLPGRDFPYLSHIEDRALFCQKEEPGSEVFPLYRNPQPALTAEECEAVELAAYDYLYHQDPGGRAQWIREQLLGLLARTK